MAVGVIVNHDSVSMYRVSLSSVALHVTASTELTAQTGCVPNDCVRVLEHEEPNHNLEVMLRS